MRLVTWNCCRGPYARKVPLIEALAPDVAVVQECPRPTQLSPHCLWFGDNTRQGLAIFASPEYSLRVHPEMRPDAPKYVIPISVVGPTCFTLMAVWTLAIRPDPYVRAASKAVRLYGELIAAAPTILMGDFNSNAIWDAEHPHELNHSALVRQLSERGSVSAYHHHFGEEHGRELRPTFYLHRNQERPYHIDYCFLSREWGARITRVEVPPFEEWRLTKDHLPLSDHRPLIVDLLDD